jgi:hypothetical protein
MTEDQIDPQAALVRMEEGRRRLAAAKAERVYLEEFRKSKKALLMQASGAKTSAEQERDAYAHPEYQALLIGLKSAVEAEEALRWRMVIDQTKIDVWRSQESSNRMMDRGTK